MGKEPAVVLQHCEEADCQCQVDQCRDIHCIDETCICRQEYDTELYAMLDAIWRDTGPADERSIPHGWLRTSVEPWRSIASNLDEWKISSVTV